VISNFSIVLHISDLKNVILIFRLLAAGHWLLAIKLTLTCFQPAASSEKPVAIKYEP